MTKTMQLNIMSTFSIVPAAIQDATRLTWFQQERDMARSGMQIVN